MIFEKYESNVQSYARSFPAVFTKAQGAILTDEEGKEYIDFLAGAGSLNYGHNHPEIKRHLVEYLQNDNICHSLDLHTVAKREFLDTFARLILQPRGLNYKAQFTGPTGTNAVEAAMKLARKVTGRSNIVSFTNGFHGVTLGSLAAAGNSFYRNSAGVSTNNITFMPYDGYLGEDVDTIEVLQKSLRDSSSGLDLPAAVIVETVQGEGGVNVASDFWLQRLAQLCKQYQILLIVDDIQSGCGRTGRFFSFEQAGIEPDIIALSKSLSGYGLPMSLVLFKPELDVWKPGEHNGTFRGNNPAFITATAALNLFWQDEQFSQSIKRKANILEQNLSELANELSQHLNESRLQQVALEPVLSKPTIFKRRGRGLMQALCCPDSEIADAISEAAFQQGLIIETCGAGGNILKLLMPLTIEDDVMKKGLAILRLAALQVLGKDVLEKDSPSHSREIA